MLSLLQGPSKSEAVVVHEGGRSSMAAQIRLHQIMHLFFPGFFTDWRPGYGGTGKSDVQVRAGDSARVSGHKPLQGSPTSIGVAETLSASDCLPPLASSSPQIVSSTLVTLPLGPKSKIEGKSQAVEGQNRPRVLRKARCAGYE